ncbi:MAG: hypothetical protein MUE30_18470 [Spirosomaceae bacterium]|jgi:hypothetical protein|nr:hypothetical protein [Spirosomataceae bacterium]
MAYRDFTFAKLEHDFQIRQSRKSLFESRAILPMQPSEWLLTTLKRAKTMPLRSEKSRSENLISPIINEIRQNNIDVIEVFSGEILNADPKAKLNGEVDFIFVHYPQSAEIREPIFNVTEAKRGAVEEGWAQCAAQMYGARVFNQKHDNAIVDIYGAVSNGYDWQFLSLEAHQVFIDDSVYTIDNLPQLLGILQFIVDNYR